VTATRRERRGEGSVHQRPNGTWCGQIDLGLDSEGKRRRRTIYAPSEPALRAKMKAERRILDDHGDLSTSDPRLDQWLTDWLGRIAARRVKPATFRAYRTAINQHITPSIGRIRLSRLGVAHVRKMHADITDRLSPTTAHHAHRVLSAALADAVLEGKVGRNIASIVPAPAKAENDRTRISSDVAKRILIDAADPRWYVAFLLGNRRGERLGMRETLTDLDRGVTDLSWNLVEVTWAHGCGDTCGLTPRRCPKRRLPIPKGMRHELLGDRAMALLTPKSKRSRRIVPLPDLLVEILLRLREATADWPNPYDLVFRRPDGSPIPPRQDWQDWHDLLEGMGLPHIEPHTQRHTTATLLMELNVPLAVAEAILGHSAEIDRTVYQHADLEISRAALSGLADRLELTSAATDA
jgi:integrase